MKNLIKLENVGQFLLALYFFNQLNYPWWVFPACLLLPDVSMAGYLFNLSTGAMLYNIFHHKFLAITVLIMGFIFNSPLIILCGSILFAHAAMDRIFGFGLKYNDSFKHTHLSNMAKN